MKKTISTLAIVATILVSCKKIDTNSKTEIVDSTAVAVDSTLIDTPVSDDEARDYLKDTVK
jgi:hypothetical protein